MIHHVCDIQINVCRQIAFHFRQHGCELDVLARAGIEVRGPVGELGERGVEVARHVAGNGCGQEHSLGRDALVQRSGRDRRRGTEEDGPGQPLGRSYRVKLWPTLVFLRDGQEVARLVRPQDAQEIADALQQIGSVPH